MQFKPELIEKILVGEKTQTRRPVKSKDERWFDDWDNTIYVYRNNRIHWATGRTYAICPGRGKPQVARFRLLFIRREDVRHISNLDSIAEGFRDYMGFLKTWTGFYDPSHITGFPSLLEDRPAYLYDAWVLEFELVP
jgi:hypothetical protein